MARPRKIRLTENDRKEYAKLVKNTKAKASRTLKNVGRLITDAERDKEGNINIVQKDVMQLFHVPLLEDFETRQEFNEWKESQKKINSGQNPHYNFKKNEHGVAVTDYLLNVKTNREYLAKREQEKEQAKAKKNKEAEERAGYMKYPDRIGFGRISFNFEKTRGRSDLERSMERLIRESKGEEYGRSKKRMMDNWLDSVAGSFHNGEANDILDRFKLLSPDEWYDMYQQFYDDMTFRIYDSEGQLQSATDDNLDALRQYLDDYDWNQINFDMKDF